MAPKVVPVIADREAVDALLGAENPGVVATAALDRAAAFGANEWADPNFWDELSVTNERLLRADGFVGDVRPLVRPAHRYTTPEAS